MTTDLAGILPVLPTPFSTQGKVARDAMRQIVRFALQSGVSGVVFPGFASEVETLTREERLTLLRVVMETVDGRVPVVAGASAQTAEQVIDYGLTAAEMGIGHLMVQPPKTLTAADAAAFMAAVATALPQAQIILQNAPAPRGSDFSPEELLAIARAAPRIVYVKEETLPAGPAIEKLLNKRPAQLKGVIGGGGGRYILDEYKRGACAAMPAVELADIHVGLDRAWRSGDRASARQYYIATLPLLVLQAVYRMRLTKHVLKRRGVVANCLVRAASPPLDAIAIADIDANIAELNLSTFEEALVK